jgi:hypothetical protein
VTNETASTPDAVKGEVRLRSWERVAHGLYAMKTGRLLADELRAWSLALPSSAAFTHLTAAEFRGWWLPATLPHPLFVSLPLDDQRRRPGLFACRHPKPGPYDVLGGLRIASAAEILLACARDLGVLDLVIMGDSALRLGHCTVADLELTAAKRRRGAPLLREVIPLLDARSESPWESVMRVLHQAASIPVVPQREISSASGAFVARGDLWLVGTRRIHEYDGAGHRDAEVHRRDLDRDRRLVRAGWQRMGFTSGDLLSHGPSIIADVDQLLGRTWDSRRLLAWTELIDSSLFGRTGRARALAHWQRASAS